MKRDPFIAVLGHDPLAIMPPWLKIVARVNPLSYEVDALRALMITGGTGVFGLLMDFGVLAATALVLVPSARASIRSWCAEKHR